MVSSRWCRFSSGASGREGCKHDGTENAAAAGNQIVIDVPLPSSLDTVTRLQPMN
jgi:hypothetical protein